MSHLRDLAFEQEPLSISQSIGVLFMSPNELVKIVTRLSALVPRNK